ncbi:MAG TPA: helix-turn-helix transcriptional regulator, partial [Candidatus Limnocylindria bacterium]|nr:helix-turn-helix transcriptional regulator [Candidatus Limnocylindria bacterium]
IFHGPIVEPAAAPDLLAVATSTALHGAGLAIAPRLPNPVAVAVEFGHAGHGWAGALVFNVWLRREMRERRMSQRQLAYLAGVNHSTISRILSDGRAPSLNTATKLAHALRMDWSDEKIAAYFDILDERGIPPTQRVEAALRGDPDLRDDDIRALMNAYLVRRGRPRVGRHAP